MNLKDLPPTNSSMFLDRVREMLQTLLGRSGDRRARLVTVGDLEDAGIASARDGYIATGNGSVITAPEPDLTPPPPPTGFVATAGTTNILFEVDVPTYTMGHGHARTVVYAANYSGSGPLPTFSDAVEYFNFSGPIGAGPFDPASNLRLWARWVSRDGGVSPPAGGTNGITAATGLIDDAKIASLSAAKILAGSLAVGQYIQSADYLAGTSGWRIQTLSGGSAFMEVNGGAKIGGATIGATFIQSNNYTLDTAGWRLNADGTGQIGAFKVNNDSIQSVNYTVDSTGWKLNNNGTGQIGGFRIASDYIESTNYVAATSGWRITRDGQILSKSFNIDAAGNATFAGALNAATGTFAGNLSAAGGTFTGALSAASGSFSGILTAQVVETANIVGAAVTTTSAATGSSSASASVTVPAAGAQTLVVFCYPGHSRSPIATDADELENYIDKGRTTLNGVEIIVGRGMGVHIVQNPTASTTYTASIVRTQYGTTSEQGCAVVLILTKR